MRADLENTSSFSGKLSYCSVTKEKEAQISLIICSKFSADVSLILYVFSTMSSHFCKLPKKMLKASRERNY
jgi:hypothetical protein